MKQQNIPQITQKTFTFCLTIALTILLGAVAFQAQTSPNDIAFSSNRDGNFEIYTMRADGTNQTNITNSADSESFPDWSPDGSRIVFVRTNGIWTMNADGTNQIQLTNVGTDTRPNWSPDGSKIAFSRGAASTGINIFVMNADGSNPVQLTTAASGEENNGARWSPNGARIVFASIRSASGIDREIYVMNANGSNQTALTDNTAADALPDWSPDGSRIAFHTDRDGNFEIYVMNANGSNQTRITDNPTTDVAPGWSPDGTKFVFLTRRDGNLEIYTMNADGSNPVRLTSNTAADDVARWKSSSVFMTGLSDPVKMITAGQTSLMVAEAGTNTPNTGRISLVNRATGARRTLIDGMPSGITRAGGEPQIAGVSGLKLNGQKLYLTIAAGDTAIPVTGGLIANPAPSSLLFNSVLELTLPADYETLASDFTLSADNQTTLNGGGQVTLTNAEGKQLTVRLVVNLPNFVSEPRPTLPENIRESNLYGIELSGDSLYVVDASYNLLYRIFIAGGAYETFATFERKPNPTPVGPPFIEAVPDSIRLVGNNLLISFLTGFPFVQGLAEVRSINLNTRAQQVFISGLTMALDVLPFNGTGDNDSYLVLEFSANVLAQQPGRLKLFTSRTETPRILAANLITPTSLARDAQTGRIFVTEKATGRIMRVTAPRAAPLDYFGTGRSNYLLFDFSDPNEHLEFDILRNSVIPQPQIRQVFWGFFDDYPVFGDYDGDLKTDVGVWRPQNAENPNQAYFYIKPSSNPNPNAILGVPWGVPTDSPISGDFDGDGKDDFAVARIETNNLVWYILPSGGGFRVIQWGAPDDVSYPTGADFNGDGRDDLIVVRTDATSGDMTTYVGDALTGNLILAQQWGNANSAQGGAAYLFYGNYLGDSRADILIYYGACPSNPTCEIAGTFWLKETGSSNYTVTKFGVPLNNQTFTGDFPTEGDFDGDGKLDISVFRPTDNTFYSLLSSNGQIKAQYFDGDSATPLANKNTLEDALKPRGKSIPAGALKGVMVFKQPDGTFKMERARDFYFKR